jgi:tubulin polyglutamylase TTLL1/tubulin monoglycylase TTLL3/8
MEAYFDYRSMEGYLPLTFHITGGLEDEEYLRFLREFYKRSKEGYNWWIVKPGELSNRGRDIKYCENLNEVKEQIKQKKTNSNGSPRTYIVQSYLEKPFLYQGRKFDLRHYLMITSTEGKIRGYFYQ